MMRLLLCFTIFFATLPPQRAHAAPATIERAWQLVDVLKTKVEAMKANETTITPQMIEGAQAGLLFGTASVIARLKTEDYNEFLLQSMERYLLNPDDREIISLVWKFARAMVAYEFESYKPQFWQPIADGLGNWLILLLVLRSPTRFLARKIPITPDLQLKLNAASRPGKLLTGMGITNEVHQNLIFAGIGAMAIASIRHLAVIARTHKIDSVPAFQLLQTYIGCDLVYSALEEQTDYQKVGLMMKQASQLAEEWSELNDLNVLSEEFKKIRSQVPRNPEWDRIFGRELRCDQIGMDRLKQYLTPIFLRLVPKETKKSEEKTDRPEPPKPEGESMQMLPEGERIQPAPRTVPPPANSEPIKDPDGDDDDGDEKE